MAKMQKADLAYIVENSVGYIREESVRRSAFFGNGVLRDIPDLNINKGGTVVIPNFGKITSTHQIVKDNTSLTVNKIGTGKQVGVVVNRADAWAVNDLVGAYAGTDFVGEIEAQLGQYWSEQIDNHAISVVKGVAGALSATHGYNISGAALAADQKISAKTLNAAFHRLGDARSKLGLVVCHSDVVQALEDAALIDTIQPNNAPDVTTVRRRPIVETDVLAPTGDVYDMYIVAPGLLGFGEGLQFAELEHDRDILAKDDVLTSTRSYTIHPLGMTWGGPTIGVNGETPTDAQFATAGNWTRVFDVKNIGLVHFRFKL